MMDTPPIHNNDAFIMSNSKRQLIKNVQNDHSKIHILIRKRPIFKGFKPLFVIEKRMY